MTRSISSRQAYAGRFIGAALAALFAATAMAQPAPAPKLTPAQASLLAAEDQLMQAEAKHDMAAISKAFADDGVFIHANGLTQSKSEYMHAIESGQLDYHSIAPHDQVPLVSSSGDLGAVRGKMDLVVGKMHLSGLYLALYVMRDGRWQMLTWQSSMAPRPVTR